MTDEKIIFPTDEELLCIAVEVMTEYKEALEELA